MEFNRKGLADAMEKLDLERGGKAEKSEGTIDENLENAVSGFVTIIEKARKDTDNSILHFDYLQPAGYYS